MKKCPTCGGKTIALWRVLLVPQNFSVGTCEHCAATVKRKHGWVDLLALLPMALANLVIFTGARETAPEAFSMLGGAALLGTVMWLMFVELEVKMTDLDR